ncbi:FAD/NAD(P)-binding protein [Vibrio mimicus]|uniref:FAD/NAD(P)-binding protein n=1 Tax=Vibrio mimicus TaxID=674 RepID=UPI0012ACFDDC|nr:FAD/NAD(P)-binding protein [Vibrio mimicus]QXC55256.1 FAD/NAD(P)-binding protein [Vibrio mimicus]
MTKIKNIAIIGAGPSGLSAYLQLVKEQHTELSSITLFDPQGVGKSFSFHTDLASSLTNTSVGVTSLYADDKLDYFKWLRDKKPELNVTCSDFISRFYFSEYCLDRFQQSKDYAASFGCSTLVERSEVKALAYKNERMIVTNQDDIDFVFDAVILATGIRTAIPNEIEKGCENFVATPYPERHFLSRVNNHSNVLILGSKLSAIDVAVAIYNHYPAARMTMVSRSGELPSVRDSLLIKKPSHLDLTILSRLSAPSCYREANVAEKLGRDIANCKSNQNDWEDIVGQFIEEFNEQIPFMPTARQLELSTQFHYFIKHYVSSFPLKNAEIVLNAIASGRLHIIQKNLSEYLCIQDNKVCGNNAGVIDSFDLVINASGISHKPLNDELIGSLSVFSVRRNKSGGLSLDASTMKVNSDNNAVPLYVIGGPATGEVPITNYVRSSVIQAKKIVSHIAMLDRQTKIGLLSHYA